MPCLKPVIIVRTSEKSCYTGPLKTPIFLVLEIRFERCNEGLKAGHMVRGQKNWRDEGIKSKRSHGEEGKKVKNQ